MSYESILYFDNPGPENTDNVIEAVRKRLDRGGIKYVIVASESGRTALKVAEKLKEFDIKIICVSVYAGVKRPFKEKWPTIEDTVRKRLKKLNVKILEETQWIFKCTFDYAFLGKYSPSNIIHTFLSRVLGFGFKTAIEITLIASEAGAIPTNEEVIAIAGTGWLGGGADCAIVVKPAHIYNGEFIDLEKGMEVKEILAIPRLKFDGRLIRKIKESKIEY